MHPEAEDKQAGGVPQWLHDEFPVARQPMKMGEKLLHLVYVIAALILIVGFALAGCAPTTGG